MLEDDGKVEFDMSKYSEILKRDLRLVVCWFRSTNLVKEAKSDSTVIMVVKLQLYTTGQCI